MYESRRKCIPLVKSPSARVGMNRELPVAAKCNTRGHCLHLTSEEISVVTETSVKLWHREYNTLEKERKEKVRPAMMTKDRLTSFHNVREIS